MSADQDVPRPPAHSAGESMAKRAAYILGPSSAAQLALDDLARRRSAGEDAGIWLVGNRWIVGPVPAHADGAGG